MQSQIDALIASALNRYETIPPNTRLLISLSGVPGSGKTTLASYIVQRLNQRLGGADRVNVAATVPMDGYHLPRAALSAMPDPAAAHFRRGAPWTFSPAKLAALIASCRAPICPSPSSEAPTIYAASFDHAVKDPVEDDIPITPEQRILIFEGNYLSLSAPPEWLAVSSQFDERWFVEVDEEVAKQRLARRHLKAGIVGSLEEGVTRAEGNDIPNGRFLIANRVPVDQVLTSVEDVNFAEA